MSKSALDIAKMPQGVMNSDVLRFPTEFGMYFVASGEYSEHLL